jgi:hypothetical protein
MVEMVEFALAFIKEASLPNKPLEFFELNLLEMRKQLNLMKTAVTTSTKALLA